MVGSGSPVADQLPAGFVLDKPAAGLPEGFVLDQPGIGDKINEGVALLGTQFTKGINQLAGAPSDLQALGQKGVDYVLSKVTGHQFNTPAPTMPGSADLNKAVFEGAGVPERNFADIKALGPHVGKVIDASLQAVPGGILTKALLPTVTSGAGSEVAGQATAGTPYEIPARLFGAVAGQRVGQTAVTPLPARLTPEQTRMVGLADQLQIPMTVGQETGRLRGVESALARFPTSAGQFANAGERQSLGINRAALDTAEAPAGLTRVDPNSMDQLFKAKNAEFNAAKSAMGPVELTPQFYNQAQQGVGNYLANNPTATLVPAVEAHMASFFDRQLAPRAGQSVPTLSGEQYQQFRKSVNDAAMEMKDPAARKALQGIRTALDDAATASSTPQAAAAFAKARENWGNLKTIAKAAAGGTIEGRGAGNLTPGALVSAVRQRQGPDVFSRTEGGLNDVSRLAGYLSDTRPNSGTPQTLMMQNLLSGGALLGGGGAGFLAGGLPGAAAAGVGLATPNILARALTGSKGAGWLRDYLANQKMADTTMKDRLVQALIGAGAGR